MALINRDDFFGFSVHEDKLSVIVVIQLAKGWSLTRETKFHLLRTTLFHYCIKSFVLLLYFFEFSVFLSKLGCQNYRSTYYNLMYDFNWFQLVESVRRIRRYSSSSRLFHLNIKVLVLTTKCRYLLFASSLFYNRTYTLDAIKFITYLGSEFHVVCCHVKNNFCDSCKSGFMTLQNASYSPQPRTDPAHFMIIIKASHRRGSGKNFFATSNCLGT